MGHTLILGWNEATVRLVCQLMYLQRRFKEANNTWVRRVFPWFRVLPSTPVAAHPVVILADGMSKNEMDSQLEEALAVRGISRESARIGREIMCRIGDPTDTTALARASA